MLHVELRVVPDDGRRLRGHVSGLEITFDLAVNSARLFGRAHEAIVEQMALEVEPPGGRDDFAEIAAEPAQSQESRDHLYSNQVRRLTDDRAFDRRVIQPRQARLDVGRDGERQY